MVAKIKKIEWSLSDVLTDKNISVDQFVEDIQKIDPIYKKSALVRLIYGDITRIHFELLQTIIILLDCEVEDLLAIGKKKVEDVFYEGSMSKLVSRESTKEYFPIEITEDELVAFLFLKDVEATAEDRFGAFVAVSDIINWLKDDTERSTYISNFLKVLDNPSIPIREDKASTRFMCFIRNSTAADGYVTLFLMSTKCVTLGCKHSFTTLDILKNYTTFRNKKKIVTPWFDIEEMKKVYGLPRCHPQDLKRQALQKSIDDIREFMGVNITLETNIVSRLVKHVRFIIE